MHFDIIVAIILNAIGGAKAGEAPLTSRSIRECGRHPG